MSISLRDIKKAIRDPYVWPGAYPLYFVMADGESLSISAAKENFKQIAYSHLHNLKDDWRVAGVDINWEDEELVCAHSGNTIECAYPSD